MNTSGAPCRGGCALWRLASGVGAFLITACLPLMDAADGGTKPGYKDSPLIPGTTWHVHDPDRPWPERVEPAEGAGLGTPPPAGAVVLFDGTSLDRWRGKDGGPASWRIVDGELEAVVKAGDIRTAEAFGDMELHIEWRVPDQPEAVWSDRGNSGVYLHGLYEIQVFDTRPGGIYADGMAGALYGQLPPRVDASRPPGRWNAYDIRFTAPTAAAEALVTVRLNGVHDGVRALGPTRHKALPRPGVRPPRGPLVLQEHGSPVRYRNIWIREVAASGT